MTETGKFDLNSMDITEDQLKKLKQVLPEVFTEGLKIDFDKLKQTLGDAIDSDDERFGMQWPGKAECFKIIQQPSIGTLKPYEAESVNWYDTENLFIEGDNLEVLKLLQKSYYGKIKMIYIDPPYNTGKEFIYPDKYSENLNTYLEYSGQIDGEGRKFSTNTETEGRFHSKWMNMIYPRLFLARNLLKDDGVIFISIDDNEVDNLKKICNDIFGEENFVAYFIWKRRSSSSFADNNVSTDHEYVICYQKGIFSGFSGNAKDFKNYKNPDSDSRGAWVLGDLTVGMTASMRPNQAYELIDPKTGNSYPYNPNRVWAYIPESMKKLLDENRIVFPTDVSKRPMMKRFQNELKSTHNPFSTLMIKQVGLNTEATRTIQQLLGGNVFDYSKPVSLLKTIIPQICSNEDIILDFFAGSAVTAHAVLALNKADDNNRKFIMVQLPEPCAEQSEAFNAGYKNIADIGKERIRRVIKKIESEQESKEADLFDSDKPKQDLGFKVFKLDKSNFKIWDGKIDDDTSISEQLELAIDHIDPDSKPEDILFEILLKAGFELTTKITELELADKTVYSIAAGALLICLEYNLTKEVITAMAKLEPARVVCLDQGFSNNDQLKTNAVQIMKSHNVEDFRTV
ncbi:MAG: site-specific DNA-methyltransferase [Victivallaceae bacterium]|nr:site-specific DNA-methyltransferase [Victivallaceae bacterium]